MFKKIAFAIVLLGLFLAISAQTVDTYTVPQIGPPGHSGDKCPSIAVNSRGDLMLPFRTRDQFMMYYFIKKSTGAVTQAQIPGVKDKDILITSAVATADDNFHALWAVVKGHIGIYYSDFDITTEKWSAPVEFFDKKITEDAHLRVNPVNDDISMCAIIKQTNKAKDVYVQFRKSGQTAWSDQINLSKMPGGKSATNPYSHFDENGYLHVVWKEDHNVGDLTIRVALIKKGTDGTYSMVDKQWATSDYSGWHFLPTVAITGTKGIITFFWRQEGGYYYLPYERSGDKLVFDQKNVAKIVEGPTNPNYTFHSRSIGHGDEIMFAYMDMQHHLQLRRYKDGTWLDSTPITLGDMEINKFPFNLWADPNTGVYVTWYYEDSHGDGHSFYSIFNYPKPTIRPPVNVTYVKAMERTMFHGYYLYGVKWENNPYNIEKNIKVVTFNIYRRVLGSSDKWLRVGSVVGTVFSYGDGNGITASSNYEYAVTAVNEKGNESRIQDEGTVTAADKKNIDKQDSER